MSTLACIIEKELEGETKNKRDEFCWKKKTCKFHSSGEKMRNTCGHQGENDWQCKKYKRTKRTQATKFFVSR